MAKKIGKKYLTRYNIDIYNNFTMNKVILYYFLTITYFICVHGREIINMFGHFNSIIPKHIKVPFQVIKSYKRESFIWAVCVIFLGQIGIFLNYFL